MFYVILISTHCKYCLERNCTLIIIVCVDDHFGMLFNQRRQSQDRILRERILQITAGMPLWMNAYSAKQFANLNVPQIRVDTLFLTKAAQGEYCFVEDIDVLPYEKQIDKVILYKWNRIYPADLYFSIPLQESGWKLVQTTEFAGSSHETITEEIYIK